MKFWCATAVFLSLILLSCKEGTDYCQPPQKVNGFKNIANSYDPNEDIEVTLDFIFNFGQEIHETTTMFAFTVPDVFVNPKGEGRDADVVYAATYTYTLKDPENAPDSVVVKGYAFNDCGKSDVASAVIRFQ